MFRLRTFGGLWLERDHLRVGGTSPRRLGLLAAVVAAGDHGISRDRLLLLLWPDSTEAKARHALAQTLYSFRRELGDDLIRSEPAELLADPSQLSSDLQDFLDARARGEFELAASLYSGPFLDGFYVPEADEFERWAELERSRLRELAIHSLESAARQSAEAGRQHDALGHWRRLSVMAPHNSRIALGYMSALAEGGDVAGAIQYGRGHELSRRQEVGAQPDPAVGALLTRLTRGEWRTKTPDLAPAVRAELGSSAQPPAPQALLPPSGPVVPPRGVGGRWVAGLGIVALAALALWLLPPILSGRDAFPAGSVIVMADPVDLTGNPGLGRALASAAAVGLQQSRHLTPLSRNRLAGALRRMGRGGDSVLTDSLALEVATRENARAMFSLTIAEVSGKYILTGRLVSPADGEDIAAHRVSVDGIDEVLEGLDRLVREIQASAGDSRRYRDSLPPLPLVTTRSLEALKLYAEAGESWRRARYDRAKQLFERAVAVDSSFALAHAALGSWYYFMNDRPSGDAHYAVAQRLRDRLTFREQLYLDSRLAAARGDRAEESRIDRTLAERYPSWETWYSYGTTLMRLNRCGEGIPALQRALAFDSSSANTYINIATCYKGMGENRLALDAYAAAERVDSTALVTNFINHEWGGVFVRMGRYPEADSAFRRMLARPDQNDQARGHRSLAYLDMLQGRYRSAIEHLAEAAVLSRATGARLSLMRNEVLLAEAHLVRDQPALASRELDAALDVARSQYVEPGFLALLGRMLVRAGRTGDARDVLGRVERALKPENPTDRSARGLLLAELALARGAPEAAWEAIRTDIDPTLEGWRSGLMGRVLEARGVLDSALAVAAAFSRSSGFGVDTQADWAMAPLQVARIAEALGDSATARAALQALLDRWKDGDPDLRVLRATRADLARLRREARR
ncbi:MAG TPA: BTAD domain-containing putative transcriptional regulator [Gemmatimonadales bacterium]|nr:BTAD domain-containing putative transcriptional regulator [Gemmatimonadales bacterium]